MFKSKLFSRWRMRLFVLMTLGLGCAASAWADCPTPQLPKTFTYGTIAVSSSLPVGSVIPGTVQGFTLTGKCSGAGTFNTPVVACPWSQTLVNGTTDVYSTGLTGVGMRMRNSGGVPLTGSGECGTTSSLGMVGADGSFNVSGTLELVKTGPISAGTINMANAYFRTGVLNTKTLLNDGNDEMRIATGTAFRQVTCSVTSSTAYQTVLLATISPSALAAAGSTAAKTPFSIALACESGVKVAVTFTSASGNSGIASVLGSNGTAKGVGVQLLNASQTPITLDAPLQLTASTTGNDSFLFYGQYYRLGAAAVTSGTVRAAATFTMNYQ